MLGKRVIKTGYQAKHDNMLALEAEIGNTTARQDKQTDELDNLGNSHGDLKKAAVNEQGKLQNLANVSPYEFIATMKDGSRRATNQWYSPAERSEAYMKNRFVTKSSKSESTADSRIRRRYGGIKGRRLNL